MPSSASKLKNIFTAPLYLYPIMFIDYLWVTAIYVGVAFLSVVIIDGHILGKFDIEYVMKRNSFILALEILVQLVWQGFVAIMLSSFLHNIYSPVEGLYGYTTDSVIGHLLRTPAIISIILFSQSKALQGKIQVFFSRYDKNNVVTIPIKHDENPPQKDQKDQKDQKK
jgi:hypothetical protein